MVAYRSESNPATSSSHRWEAWAGVGLTALVLYLVIAPLGMLLFSSLKNSGTKLPFQVPGFSLNNFTFILTNPGTLQVLGNTAFYVAGSLLLSMVLTICLVYLLERTDIPGRQSLTVLVLSPMAIPPLVMAMAWAFLANPSNGLLSGWIQGITGHTVSIYSLVGMVLVTALVAVPSQYLLLAPQFAQIDPAMEDAAAVSGASFLRRTRRITLALVKPALLAVVMLFVVVSVELFDIPAILGLPKKIYLFSTLIQQSVEPVSGVPNYGLASGYGVLLLMVALALVLIYRRAMRQGDRFRTITGKGYRPNRVALGRWRRPAVGFIYGYFLFAVGFPCLILLYTSLLPYYAPPTWSMLQKLTLANYVGLIQYPGIAAAAVHTIIIVLASATATIMIATWAAWVSVRRRFRLSWLPVESSFLVLGVPGVVMGVALIYLYLTVPIPLYGTVWIIVVAYVTRFLAYAVRLMDSALRQVDKELEEAGSVCGASYWTVAARVMLPLVWPAAARGWLWIAVHAVSELPMALILQAAGNQTVAVALWNLWTTNGNFAIASALAIVLLLFSSLATWLVMRNSKNAADAAVVV